MNTVIQILIVILSCSAIWLVGRTEKWSRWGYITGLAGQPLWLYTTASNEQWGLFILSVFYIYCWGMGIYNFWIKKPNQPKRLD